MYADPSCKVFPSESIDPDDLKARQILRNAALLIRTQGHTKYAQHDERGYCVHGALFMADIGITGVGLESHSRAGLMAVTRLTSYLKIPPMITHRTTAVDWNNAPERQAYEVINALEAAADV